ncbi:hypothetical protein ABPG72_005954 [Tetrahymena utriculariae]
MKREEQEQKSEFIALLQKQENRGQNGTQNNQEQTEKKSKPILKVKVKALKGSPYVISLEDTDIVGEGSFGKVVRAYDIKNQNEDLVAKIIPLDDHQKYESMQMELKVLCKLPQHVNLVNYKKIKMSSQNKQYFIMDYCNGGTLTQYLKNQKKISENEILEFLQQFCRGYRVLYKEGIIHRDIKPDNILMHNRIFKIADFGLAKIVDTLQVQNISTRGTPLYIAPELVKKEKASSKVDMWSLGVILFRMLFKGQYPFLDPLIKYDVPTALKHIQQKKLVIPSNPQRSPEIIDLVKRMLEKDESKRISWEELFNHNLIAFSLNEEENENLYDDISEESCIKAGQKLVKSSVFIKKMEIVRQSKIQITHLSDKKSQQKKNSQDQTQNNKFSTDMESSSSQEDEKKENNQQLKEKKDKKFNMEQINMKTMQTLVRHSQKRLKTNLSINKIEDILLNYREKVLFLDAICLRMMVMNKLVEKQLKQKQRKQNNSPQQNQQTTENVEKEDKLLEQYCTLSQQGIFLLLEMAQIFNKQLQNFKPEQCQDILKEEWNDFLMSDNQLNLSKLLKQDKGCLNEFAKQYIQENEKAYFDKKEYQSFISQLNMERLLEEIHVNIQELLKLFPLIYEQMGDYKKGLLILFTYLFEAYSLNSDNCVFHDFKRFQDYWAYYEDIEQNRSEMELYTQLVESINNI